MGKRSRKRGYNWCNLSKTEKLRRRHHDHTKKRIRTRYGLRLDDDQLVEIIALIQKNRKERVKFVREGKKKNGDLIYIVIFYGKALAIVYNSERKWLITCLRVKWVLEGLPQERVDELRKWLRERCSCQKNQNGNARQ